MRALYTLLAPLVRPFPTLQNKPCKSFRGIMDYKQMAGDFVADQVHAHVLAPARVVCLKAAWPPGWIPFALPGWASPDPPPGGNPGTPRVMVRRLPRASDESFVWGMVAAYGDVYEFSVTLSGAEPLRTSDIENFKTALRTVPKTIRPKFREVGITFAKLSRRFRPSFPCPHPLPGG